MSDPDSIALDAAYGDAMADEEEAQRQAVIENLQNDLYESKHKGPDAAGKKQTQSAEDYWEPYVKQYRKLRDDGMKAGEARRAVDAKIRSDGSWPPGYLKNRKGIGTEPSQRSLEKWLK